MRAALFFKNITFLLITGLWLAITTGFAAANAVNANCSVPVFGVAGVMVDERAETASLARDNGAAEAAKQAFETVINRIVADADKRHAFLGQSTPDAFLDFVHIVAENSLEQRYIATLDFCFDAVRLRAALTKADLQWAELESPPVLVLPIWRGPDGVHAWHKHNAWIAGWWQAVDDHAGLLRLRRLTRNLANERRFRGEDIAAGLATTLSAAAKQAGVSQVVVAEAALDFNGWVPEVTVTAALFDKDGALIRRFDRQGPYQLAAVQPVELADSRDEIIRALSRDWYAANRIDGSARGAITAAVPVASLAEWARRLAAFEAIAVIDGYDIVTLNAAGGQIRLRLVGTREALENALAVHNLKLTGDQGDLSLVPAN